MQNDIFNHLNESFFEQKIKLSHEQLREDSKYRVEAVLRWEIYDYHSRMKEWMVHTGVNITTSDILSMYWLEISEFENKVTLDIGWGFSDLPFLLENIYSKTIIVDPIFDYIIKSHIEKNINTLEKYKALMNDRIKIDKKRLNEIENILDVIDYSITSQRIQLNQLSQEKNWLNKQINTKRKLLNTYDALITTLNKWLDLSDSEIASMFSEQWHKIWKNTLNINPSSGDNIEWIQNNSIDYIFINHVITKSTIDSGKVLKQADRLLKVWWKIYIMENDTIYVSENEYFPNYDLETKYENDKSIFILTKKS